MSDTARLMTNEIYGSTPSDAEPIVTCYRGATGPNENIAKEITGQLELTLKDCLDYNIYLKRFEIKNSIIESLEQIIKRMSKRGVTGANSYLSGSTLCSGIETNQIYLLNKDDLSPYVADFNTDKEIEKIRRKAMELAGVTDSSKTTVDSLTGPYQDINIGLCFYSILTIAKGIKDFNDNHNKPESKVKIQLELNEIPLIVNYYRYIYIYKLVRTVEELLIAKSNYVYIMTFILSSIYDESKFGEKGKEQYLDITPDYVDYFFNIVKVRKNSPIVKASNDEIQPLFNQSEIEKNAGDIKYLLKVLFEKDKTFKEYINNVEYNQTKKDIESQSGVEESESLKAIKTPTTTATPTPVKKGMFDSLRSLGKSNSLGGGLIFNPSETETKFIDIKQFESVMGKDKRKKLAENERELEEGGINGLFDGEFLTKFNGIDNQELKTGFILFVDKFYKVSVKDIEDLKTKLNPSKSQVQLDALDDIIVTKNESQKDELLFEAQVYKQKKKAEEDEATRVAAEKAAEKPKESAISKLTSYLKPAPKVGGGLPEDKYYEKYLKYKEKYTELKKQMNM
jgi:hypothetical protein